MARPPSEPTAAALAEVAFQAHVDFTRLPPGTFTAHVGYLGGGVQLTFRDAAYQRSVTVRLTWRQYREFAAQQREPDRPPIEVLVDPAAAASARPGLAESVSSAPGGDE